MPSSEPKFHSPAPGKYHRLVALGEVRFRAMESLLLDGVSPEVVGRKIQNEWEEFGDVKPDTLTKQLQRYRDEVLEPRVYETSRRAKGRKDFFIRARRMSQDIDVGEEIGSMYLTQKGRINRLLKQEDAMPSALLNQVREEMRVANTLLDNLKDFQLKTGVVKAAPKEIHGVLTVESSPGKEAFTRMVENQDSLRTAAQEAIALLGVDPDEDIEDAEFAESGYSDEFEED